MNDQHSAGSAAEPICVYDGNCGICTQMARWASRRTDIEFTDHADLSHRGVEDWEFEQYLIYAGDTVERGHRAVGSVLQTMSWPYSWLGRVINFKPLAPVASAGYRLVARNRPHIPKWLFPA